MYLSISERYCRILQ